ncbi:Spermidine synthase [Hondaea fermentalgiana]|uniref:thermospermine synthase n=1 Tax=Hondaea fermentalgiana TaxID=2315210 RepID=A0A2R5G8N6_9STRA|nr:Spermidine synthase [Hondaea fermentalgiana]|eukprot:GBG26905.1 Spermidine synthase [Hondaea fermentalgiana]
MEVRLQVSSQLAAGALAGVVVGAAASGGLRIVATRGREWVSKTLFGPSSSGGKKAQASAKPTRPAASTTEDIATVTEEEEEERAEERDAFWFKEGLTEDFRVELALQNISFDARSTFQRVQVIETTQFGRTLVMDGQTQSAEADEHIYHESLVHPAMLLHKSPKKVFIGGGGEFATAREVLRHSSVERCVMIDIDEVACDICRKQLPEWNGGAYEDPRFHVKYKDALRWLEDTEETFDVIIMDICDPIEAGPGYKLYTNEFYEYVQKHRLNEGGILVTQSGPGAVYNAQKECFTVIHSTLRSAFDVVVPYAVDVPSFGCNWGFNLAFKSSDPEADKRDVLNRDVEEFNNEIEKRIKGGMDGMRFLDGLAWRGISGLPKEIRQQCEEEDRVMTIDNPVFMFAS